MGAGRGGGGGGWGLRGGGRSAGGGGGSCKRTLGTSGCFPEEFYNSNGTQNRHEYLHITSELVFMGVFFSGGGGGDGAFFLVPLQ